jgi:hypothetical protein
VVQGTISADDASILLQRIKKTPRAVDELFGIMLGNVNDVHKASLAFYVTAVSLTASLCHLFPRMEFDRGLTQSSIRYMTSIAIMTATKMTAPIPFDDTFLRSCQQTEVQIGAQSAGLLEVRNKCVTPSQNILWESGSDWFIPHKPRLVNSTHRDLPPLFRVWCKDSVPYPQALDYESRRLYWVHRSAHDFVHNPHTIQKFGLTQLSSTDVLSRLNEGGLKYLAIAPSYRPPKSGTLMPGTLMSGRLEHHLAFLRLQQQIDLSNALVTTDQLYDLVQHLDPRELAHGNKNEPLFPANINF